MKKVIKDIEENKTPNIPKNDWGELANKYRMAAQTIDKAPLSTEFDSKEYAVSLDEMKNCKLKQQSLEKMNGYLKELKDGQERGKESIIKLNQIVAKIKISREVLRYCIDVHQKLMQVPIFGQKFALDWLELEIDVTDALNIFEQAIQKQRKKIKAEQAKLDMYVPNFESNLRLVNKYYTEKCKEDDEIEKLLQKELSKTKKYELTPVVQNSSNTYFMYFFLEVNSGEYFFSPPIPYNTNEDLNIVQDKALEKFKPQIISQASGIEENKFLWYMATKFKLGGDIKEDWIKTEADCKMWIEKEKEKIVKSWQRDSKKLKIFQLE
jgi:hypothetical protein